MEIRESFVRALRNQRIKASYLVGDELLWLMEKLIWNSVLAAWQRQIRTPYHTGFPSRFPPTLYRFV